MTSSRSFLLLLALFHITLSSWPGHQNMVNSFKGNSVLLLSVCCDWGSKAHSVRGSWLIRCESCDGMFWVICLSLLYLSVHLKIWKRVSSSILVECWLCCLLFLVDLDRHGSSAVCEMVAHGLNYGNKPSGVQDPSVYAHVVWVYAVLQAFPALWNNLHCVPLRLFTLLPYLRFFVADKPISFVPIWFSVKAASHGSNGIRCNGKLKKKWSSKFTRTRKRQGGPRHKVGHVLTSPNCFSCWGHGWVNEVVMKLCPGLFEQIFIPLNFAYWESSTAGNTLETRGLSTLFWKKLRAVLSTRLASTHDRFLSSEKIAC